MDDSGIQFRPETQIASKTSRPPLEKTIVANGMKVARSLGWWCVKMVGNSHMPTGIPDVLAIKGGHAVWMEFKRPGCDPTRIQLHRLSELDGAGCTTAVVRSAGEVREVLVGTERLMDLHAAGGRYELP